MTTKNVRALNGFGETTLCLNAIIDERIHYVVEKITIGPMLLSLLNHLVGRPVGRTLLRRHSNGHYDVLRRQGWVRLQVFACRLLQQED